MGMRQKVAIGVAAAALFFATAKPAHNFGTAETASGKNAITYEVRRIAPMAEGADTLKKEMRNIEKNKINIKEKIVGENRIFELEGGTQAVFRKDDKVVVSAPETDGRREKQNSGNSTRDFKKSGNQTESVMLSDSTIKTADAYFSEGTGTHQYVNNELFAYTYAPGQVQTSHVIVNCQNVFTRVDRVYQANYALMPEYGSIKQVKVQELNIMGLPPLDTNNYELTYALIRQRMVANGVPYAAAQGLMFLVSNRGPPAYQLPSDWNVMVTYDLDSLGAITMVRAPPVIASIGLGRAYVIPPGNPNMTFGNLQIPTSVISNSGNGNFTYGITLAIVGGANVLYGELNPNHVSFMILAWQPVGIAPIGGQVPAGYSLSQNYPNPFNSATKIGFGIPKKAHVTLVVYDLLGRVVSTIANGEMAAGKYEAGFDAGNLSSGIYFYKLSAGDFSSVKTMVLAK